jgi:hypothetical protein
MKLACLLPSTHEYVAKIIINNNNNSKSFRKYVSNIPGNHEVKELHKELHTYVGKC